MRTEERAKECPEKDEQAKHLLHALRMCGDFLSYRRGQRPAQNRVMFFLHKHGAITQKELQELLAIQQGSLSELLARMEKLGLISRRRDPEDRRQVILELTELGEAEEKVNHERFMAENNQLFAALSSDEQAELYRMLGCLLEDWKQKNPKAFPEDRMKNWR